MSSINLASKLPLDCQSFVALRSRGAVYVDKTAFVYQIARQIRPQILTRPQRFGKSTLLSTLEELFLHGVKPLADQSDSPFKGLAIEPLWKDSGHYLVLHLDFHDLNSGRTAAQFEAALMGAIASFCHEQALSVPDDPLDFGAIFGHMLKQLAPMSLVLLVDEYDSPLLYHAHEPQELAVCKNVMRQLYSAVKRNSGKFRCVFFTGITRFQDLDLGTSGNSFTDLSLDPRFASCCGYTRDELKQYFASYLRHSAAIREGCAPEAVSAEQIETLLDDMSAWYDGYSFDGSQQNKVFSTWSVLRFFDNVYASTEPYWSFEEGLGLPQLLKISLDRIDLKQLLEQMEQGEIVLGAKEFMESSLINPQANPYSLLFQTGYLTFTKLFTPSSKVHLACPNEETKLSFTNLLARHFFNLASDICSSKSKQEVLAALTSLDPEQLRSFFNNSIEILPYTHCPNNEFWVTDLVTLLLFGIGFKPRLEVMSLNGRADCVFDVPQCHLTVVFEFKYEASFDQNKLDDKLAEALQQIKDRKYALNGNSEPRVARFGLVFCGELGKRGFARVALADVLPSNG